MHTSAAKSMPPSGFSEVRDPNAMKQLSYILTIRLSDNRATIMEDPFIKSYIGELLRSLRTQYLIDLIKPYTRLELSFLAKVLQLLDRLRLVVTNLVFQQLNVDMNEVEELLIGLILEGKVEGRIDQVGMRLELDRKYVVPLIQSGHLLIKHTPQASVGEETVQRP